MAVGKAAVWIAQMASGEEKRKNLSKARRMIGEAADAGAELVLLPEFFNFLPAKMTREAYAGQAEGTGGETLSMVSEIARKRGVSIIAGSIAERDGDRIYNTCCAVTPEGIVARYRKTHLFSYGIINEAQIFSPGTGTAIAEVAGMRVGMTACFDLRFPEIYRKLAMEGAQAITNVAAFLLETGRAHWMTLLRARAIENQVYVVAANQASGGGGGGGAKYYGHSCIIDPWGRVVASAGAEECLISGTVSAARVDQVRHRLNCIEAAKAARF